MPPGSRVSNDPRNAHVNSKVNSQGRGGRTTYNSSSKRLWICVAPAADASSCLLHTTKMGTSLSTTAEKVRRSYSSLSKHRTHTHTGSENSHRNFHPPTSPTTQRHASADTPARAVGAPPYEYIHIYTATGKPR